MWRKYFSVNEIYSIITSSVRRTVTNLQYIRYIYLEIILCTRSREELTWWSSLVLLPIVTDNWPWLCMIMISAGYHVLCMIPACPQLEVVLCMTITWPQVYHVSCKILIKCYAWQYCIVLVGDHASLTMILIILGHVLCMTGISMARYHFFYRL